MQRRHVSDASNYLKIIGGIHKRRHQSELWGFQIIDVLEEGILIRSINMKFCSRNHIKITFDDKGKRGSGSIS